MAIWWQLMLEVDDSAEEFLACGGE